MTLKTAVFILLLIGYWLNYAVLIVHGFPYLRREVSEKLYAGEERSRDSNEKSQDIKRDFPDRGLFARAAFTLGTMNLIQTSMFFVLLS